MSPLSSPAVTDQHPWVPRSRRRRCCRNAALRAAVGLCARPARRQALRGEEDKGELGPASSQQECRSGRTCGSLSHDVFLQLSYQQRSGREPRPNETASLTVIALGQRDVCSILSCLASAKAGDGDWDGDEEWVALACPGTCVGPGRCPPPILGLGLALATPREQGGEGAVLCGNASCLALQSFPYPCFYSSLSQAHGKHTMSWGGGAVGGPGCLLITLWGGKREGAGRPRAEHRPGGSVRPSALTACWIRLTSKYVPNLNAVQMSRSSEGLQGLCQEKTFVCKVIYLRVTFCTTPPSSSISESPSHASV